MGRSDFSGCQVGPYLLTRILGVGSAGGVYRAVNKTTKHPTSFAIKCLPKAKVSRKQGFQLIAEILYQDAVTGCPHVLTLRDIVEQDRHVFLVLDLYETDMLKAIKKKVYWRNDALIKQVFIEILDGISACHERKIFHRDLKPENIMCKADGTEIQIGDFGLATHHHVCLDGGCGTPTYMSPECCMSDEGDPYFSVPTDIWALGVILYNMVTIRDPWEVALPSDKKFRAFVEDEDHLFHTSLISEGLNVLLKWIMHPIPTKRLPILAIRDVVQEIDTFYKWHCPLLGALPFFEAPFDDPEQTCAEYGLLLTDKQNHPMVSSWS